MSQLHWVFLILVTGAVGGPAAESREPVTATVDAAKSGAPISHPEISRLSVESLPESLTLPRFCVSIYELATQ